MKEGQRKLKICGLEYDVIFATAAEDPRLVDNEGFTDASACKIYVRSTLSPSRMRDTLLHEIVHAFVEASGLCGFLQASVRGNYDRFEEALVRLVTPSLLRFVDDNGTSALLSRPRRRR